MTEERIHDAATVAARKLGYEEMKLQQLHDVFAVLPTGYGKSLCFACLPCIFDLLLPLDQPTCDFSTGLGACIIAERLL